MHLYENYGEDRIMMLYVNRKGYQFRKINTRLKIDHWILLSFSDLEKDM